MNLPVDLVERMDQWRRRQTNIPSRTKTVEELIEAGLRQQGSRKPRQLS
jgi:hypothetical protein